jgi:hypothetical protein
MAVRVENRQCKNETIAEFREQVPLDKAAVKLTTDVIEGAHVHVGRKVLEQLTDEGNSIILLLTGGCKVDQP